MYEKRKISYFNCFIPTDTQHYSPEYELKYQLVCTRNKKKNANILTRIIYLKLENVWGFFFGMWSELVIFNLKKKFSMKWQYNG